MKSAMMILAGAALAIGSASAVAETRAEKGEAELAKMLEGRVAGEPVSCIPMNRSDDLRVIEHVGVVYDDGKTIYVSRAENPNSLDWTDIPVVERFGSQLCKHDVRKTIDRGNGNVSGIVFLGDFVPYTKRG